MGTILRYLAEGVQQIWSTGSIQAAARYLAQWVHMALAWCKANPGGVIGGLLALALSRMFLSVSTTHQLLAFAGIPDPLFVGLVTILGALLGAGKIEFKGPLDRR